MTINCLCVVILCFQVLLQGDTCPLLSSFIIQISILFLFPKNYARIGNNKTERISTLFPRNSMCPVERDGRKECQWHCGRLDIWQLGSKMYVKANIYRYEGNVYELKFQKTLNNVYFLSRLEAILCEWAVWLYQILDCAETKLGKEIR